MSLTRTETFSNYPAGTPAGWTHYANGSAAVASSRLVTSGLTSGQFGIETLDVTSNASVLRVRGRLTLDRCRGGFSERAGGLVIKYQDGVGAGGFKGFRLACDYAVDTHTLSMSCDCGVAASSVNKAAAPVISSLTATVSVLVIELEYVKGTGGANGTLRFRAWREGDAVPAWAYESTAGVVPEFETILGPGGIRDRGNSIPDANTKWLSVEFEGDWHLAPSAPTVTTSAVTLAGATVTGSAFSDIDGDTHTSSQFRILDAATDVVVYDSGTVAAATSRAITGLTTGTSYYADLRYLDSFGLWSDRGVSADFRTLQVPATPTVSLRDATTVGVTATGSAFYSADAASHVSSQFRAVRSSDSVVAYDSGTVAATAGPEAVSSLVAGTRYYVQARYLDGNSNWSAWGTSALFDTKSGGNLVTDYASLKKAIARWLNRRDLEEEIPVFIQMAEQKLRRDRRCRLLVHATANITADGDTLPSAFKELESWFHDGPTYYGPIKTVGYDQLAELKATYGLTGPPRYVALVGTNAYFAPAPDTAYSTKRAYWALPTALSDSNTTNALLDACPDVYLYGALAESAPFLKDDERLMLWRAELDARLSEMDLSTWNQQFGGTVRRLPRPIGG